MTRRRDGFTLIEMLVVLLVGALLTSVVWALFGASSRHGRGIDERLSAVQAAQMLIEHLRHDLAQAMVTQDLPLRATVEEDGASALEFIAADASRPVEPGQPSPDGREILYSFDPVSHCVTRNGEAIGPAAFEAVEFRYIAPGGKGPASCVQFRVTAAAPALLERMDEGNEEAGRRGRVTLVGSVRIDSQTGRGEFPGWVEHDFETPGRAG